MQLSFEFERKHVERYPRMFEGDSYVVSVGGWRNCVVYGADSFPPTDGEFVEADLLCFAVPRGGVFDVLRSEAWSANCSHFLLFQECGAFLVPVHGEEAFVCRNRSFAFMEQCLQAMGEMVDRDFSKKGRKATKGKESA